MGSKAITIMAVANAVLDLAFIIFILMHKC